MSVLSVLGIVAIVIVLILIIVVGYALWILHIDEVYIITITGPDPITASKAFMVQYKAKPAPQHLINMYLTAGGSASIPPPAGPIISAPNPPGQTSSIGIWVFGKKPADTVPGVQPFSATQWSQHSKK